MGSNQVEKKGLTFDKALTIVTEHKPLEIEHDDEDVAQVKAQSKTWVSRIMQSFGRHYSIMPTFLDFGEVQSGFAPWQKDRLKKTRRRLDSNPQLREALAIVLFNTRVS